MPQFIAKSYDRPSGLFGVVLDLEGYPVASLGPFPTRREARAAAENYIEATLGGTVRDCRKHKGGLEAILPFLESQGC